MDSVQKSAAAGTYENPKAWGDTAQVGDIFVVSQADANNNNIYAAGDFMIAKFDGGWAVGHVTYEQDGQPVTLNANANIRAAATVARGSALMVELKPLETKTYKVVVQPTKGAARSRR